jgi:hypothetical protein
VAHKRQANNNAGNGNMVNATFKAAWGYKMNFKK